MKLKNFNKQMAILESMTKKLLSEIEDSPHARKSSKKIKVSKDFKVLSGLGRRVYNNIVNQAGDPQLSFKIESLQDYIKRYFPNIQAADPSEYFYGFVGLYFEIDDRLYREYQRNPSRFTQKFFEDYFRQLDKLRISRMEQSKFEMQSMYQGSYYSDVELIPATQSKRVKADVDREKARDLAKEQYKSLIDDLATKLSDLKTLTSDEEQLIDNYISPDGDKTEILDVESASKKLSQAIYRELSGSKAVEDTIEYTGAIMPNDLSSVYEILKGADEDDIQDFIDTIVKKLGYPKRVDVDSDADYIDFIEYTEKEEVDPKEVERINFARNFIMGNTVKRKKLTPAEYLKKVEERQQRRAQNYANLLDKITTDVTDITPEMIERELGRVHVRKYTFSHLANLIGGQSAIPYFEGDLGDQNLQKIAKKLKTLSDDNQKISFVRSIERESIKSHVAQLSDEDLTAYIRSIANEDVLEDKELTQFLSTLSEDQKVDYIYKLDTAATYSDEQIAKFVSSLSSEEIVKKIKQLTPSVAGVRQDTVGAYAAAAFAHQHPDETAEIYERFIKIYLLTLLALEKQAEVDEGESDASKSDTIALINHLCGSEIDSNQPIDLNQLDLDSENLNKIGELIFDYFDNIKEYDAINQEFKQTYDEFNGEIPREEMIDLNRRFKEASENQRNISRIAGSIENVNGIKNVVSNMVKDYYTHILGQTYDKIRGTKRVSGALQNYCEENGLPWNGVFEKLVNKVCYFATCGTFKKNELEAYAGTDRTDDELEDFAMDLLGRRKGRGRSTDVKQMIDNLPPNHPNKAFVFTKEMAMDLATDCYSDTGTIGNIVYSTFKKDFQTRETALLEDILSFMNKKSKKGYKSIYEYLFCLITEGMIQNVYYNKHAVAIVLPLDLTESIKSNSKEKFAMIVRNFPEYLDKLKELVES